MAVKHSTPADGTFSASGATAWNANHTIDPATVTTTELGGDITTAGKALLDDASASAQRTTLGLGSAATASTAAFDAAGAAAAAQSASQPLDSDLTAIAALTTTAFGRALLTLADAAAFAGTLPAVVAAGSFTSANITVDATGRITAAANGTGGGAASDMLSTLTAAEISITGTATATLGRMHVCSGTTADYTLTLPTAVGNAGKLIGVRMAAALAKFVAVNGIAMWAGEAVVLISDNANWIGVLKVRVPLTCVMSDTDNGGVTPVAIANVTITKINLNNTRVDNSGGMADPTTNFRINVKRSATYAVLPVIGSDNNTVTAAQARCNKNGANVFIASGAIEAYGELFKPGYIPFAAGDYAELAIYHSSGASRNFYAGAQSLSFVEIPSW